MNSIKFTKKLVYVNLDVVFDFKSYLYTLARYTNEVHKLGKHFNQSYFNTLYFSTIEEFIDCLKFEEKEHKEKLRENIENSKIFETVKPKLFPLCEVYYLLQVLKEDEDNTANIILYSKENYFLKILEKRNILSELKTVLNIGDVTTQRFEEIEFDKLEEVSKGLLILVDYHTDEILEKAKNSPFDVVVYKKSKSAEENVISYKQVIEKICNLTNKSNILEVLEDYKKFNDNEFVFRYCKELLHRNFKFLSLWRNYLQVDKIEITGNIINGFKRGSKLLGVPTANIEINKETLLTLQQHVNGVYYGKFIFNSDILKGKVYKGVLSIGYNPHFDNDFKTIEVFLIDYEGEDFYGLNATLTIEGFLRTEASFENFAELVTAITYDIIISNEILN